LIIFTIAAIFVCPVNSVAYADSSNDQNSTESNNVAVARKFVSGISLYDKKKYKEAAEIFEEIVDLAPTSATQLQVFGYLGFCYNELKQFEKADNKSFYGKF